MDAPYEGFICSSLSADTYGLAVTLGNFTGRISEWRKLVCLEVLRQIKQLIINSSMTICSDVSLPL